jgi:polyhydroxyalkanoate synthesis regulator phasin
MTDLLDIVKKTMITGIGLALKTKDEVEDWANDLVKRGELKEEEGGKFVDELMKRYDEAREDLENRVEKKVKELLKKANVATLDDVKVLKKEVKKLKKQIKTDS